MSLAKERAQIRIFGPFAPERSPVFAKPLSSRFGRLGFRHDRGG